MTVLLLAACAPREILFPAIGLEAPRQHDFPADFQPPISHETDQPMPGWGGGGGGVNRVPVIFVHGNTVSAAYWNGPRQYFMQQGYSGDELWALSYGWNNVRYFDSNDLSVPSLERIVNSVTNYLTDKTGKTVHQVDIIGHSLGVTLTRQWMKQTNSYHRVRSFIGTAGASDGVWTAWNDTRGQQRGVSWELYPNSEWLQQLNRGDETPGPTRYMTLYDGTGWGDVLFPKPNEDSGALEGAYNLPYNRVHGTNYGHLELPREPETMDAMIDWLAKGPKPDFTAERPGIIRMNKVIKPDSDAATLRCTNDGSLPGPDVAAVPTVEMAPDVLYTCYAYNAQTKLPGRIERFKRAKDDAPERPAPTLRFTPVGGVFEHPQRVTLESDDPDAYIVYNTSGTPIESGSPLYTDPIYIAGPVTLTAMAISPNGKTSPAVTREFDISLELLEARNTLLRQLDPEAPVIYEGLRKKGR
ncbi:hypothetical protein GYB61_01740 [bacterium]|nr:hypothetical protein [bacterium]